MDIQEAIEHARDAAKRKYAEGMLCHANPNDEELDGCIECAREHEQLADWLEELKQYKQLGTLKEVREAVERKQAKKPIKSASFYRCPHCGALRSVRQKHDYCHDCGQALLWE